MPPDEMDPGASQTPPEAGNDGGFAPPLERQPLEPPQPPYTTTLERPRKRRSAARSVADFLLIFGGAILVAYLLQAYLVKPFQIPSESMMPTIDPGDRILVNRLAYRTGTVQRGDIIVFKAPIDPGVDFVKRVIAIAGDTVEVRRGQVIVNGQLQDEPYIKAEERTNFAAQKVPEGAVFVMGDNRANSEDSRFWPVPWLNVDDIIGKAFLIYWPPNRVGGV